MALKFEIDSESFEALDDAQKALYQEHGEGYRLEVDGIDPKDELKEALRKEREERAEAKRKLQEYETAAEKQDRDRLEKNQEWEQLTKTERERSEKLERELNEMRDAIANEKRNASAQDVIAELTRHTDKAKLLKKEAMQFITHTQEGIKINGPDGDAWDAKKLSAYLKESYPFLVDGSGATGGGATGGGHRNGGAVKKFNEYSGAELSAIRKEDPDAYDRLKSDFYG